MAGLRVVEPHAVDEHQYLAEGRPAKGEVGLRSTDAAGANINRRSEPQDFRDAVDRQRGNLLPRNDRERPGDAAKFDRPRRRRDHDYLAKILRVDRRARQTQKNQASSHPDAILAYP
jgi:hypothetical protein